MPVTYTRDILITAATAIAAVALWTPTAFACSPPLTSPEAVYPADGSTVGPDVQFVVPYSGVGTIEGILTGTDSGPVDLTDEQRTRGDLFSQAMVFRPTESLAAGVYEFQANNLQDDVVSVRFTVDPALSDPAPPAPDGFAWSKMNFSEDVQDMCIGTVAQVVRLQVPQVADDILYYAVSLLGAASPNGDPAVVAAAILPGEETDTLYRTYKLDHEVFCAEVTAIDIHGQESTVASNCSPTRCGNLDADSYGIDIPWESFALCDAPHGGDVGVSNDDAGIAGGDAGKEIPGDDDEGWDLEENPASGSDEGCGCGSTTADSAAPLILVAFLVLGSRRRNRRG